MNPPAFLFRLSEGDRSAVEARWATRTYGREETILAHDEPGRDLFFVLDGRARATIFSESGRAVSYRDIEPGDIFGELAAIDGKARSANVVALVETRVARLPESAFRALVESRSGFTWEVLRHLSGQMRRMTDRVYEVSTLVVRQRLLRELLRLCTADETGRGGIVSAAPTHYDLATRISTHREAVSRAMSELAKQRLIERHGASLVLRDLQVLQNMADEGEA
jgi:CRP-like cAMP-binding protein